MNKNTIMLVAMLVFALTAKAQTLLGIPFSGSTNTFVNALVKQKGFTLVKSNTTGVKSYIMKGKILDYNCEIIILGTPKTNQVCKMVVYTDKQTSFNDLTSTYNIIYTLLESKYGKANDECLDFFKTPYERHDGYEMTAISVGKYVRMCGFGENEPNMSVYQMIDKYPQVKIVWENKQNMELISKERKESAQGEL
jgi:hypothetical protein